MADLHIFHKDQVIYDSENSDDIALLLSHANRCINFHADRPDLEELIMQFPTALPGLSTALSQLHDDYADVEVTISY